MSNAKLLLNADEKWILRAVVDTRSTNPSVIQRYLASRQRTYGRQFIVSTVNRLKADQSPQLVSQDASIPEEMNAIVPVITEVRAGLNAQEGKLLEDRTTIAVEQIVTDRRHKTHADYMLDIIGLLTTTPAGQMTEDEVGDAMHMGSSRLAAVGKKLVDDDSITISEKDEIRYWRLSS